MLRRERRAREELVAAPRADRDARGVLVEAGGEELVGGHLGAENCGSLGPRRGRRKARPTSGALSPRDEVSSAFAWIADKLLPACRRAGDTLAVQTAHGPHQRVYHRTDDAHTLLMVAALLLLTRVRPLELRSRAAVAMQATPPRDWATREDFALLDGAPAFSVGSGAQAVTFWQSMVASTPELAARSADELDDLD